jgi:hypothetical protein
MTMARVSQSEYACQNEIISRNEFALFAYPKDIGQVTFHGAP